MRPHRTATHETWLAARLELLEREKALTRLRDEVAAERRALPWVPIDKPYRLAGAQGEVGLEALFGPHEQLVVQHFMFGPDWEAGCPMCSFWADHFDAAWPHLAQRGIAFAAVSRAPLERLLAYRERMGWRFPWYSSLGSEFNFDFRVSFTDEALAAGEVYYNYHRTTFPAGEAPGVSVFARDGDALYHTYSCYARGLDALNTAYQLIDLTPRGRDEAGLPFPMAWVRRRDEYGAGD